MMLPVLVGLAEGACSSGAVTRERTDTWIAEQRARADADRLFLASSPCRSSWPQRSRHAEPGVD
ncbi:hypothetical protein [Streptomyces sp. NPDC017435]|uniref:hypothetical protein n=1 Tax=Streptomyces sp. NPDC017435 TaxID=3364995 RepID=UPI00379FBCD2